MPQTTANQQAVLAALKAHARAHGRSPTLRELGDAAGIGAVSTVQSALRALVTAGMVVRVAGQGRAGAYWPAGIRQPAASPPQESEERCCLRAVARRIRRARLYIGGRNPLEWRRAEDLLAEVEESIGEALGERS